MTLTSITWGKILLTQTPTGKLSGINTMLSGGLGMFGSQKERDLLCSRASSLATGPKIMSYLPMALGIFIWTYDTQNVTPGTLWIQNPHTASMNFYCSNHISVVCETRFLHIVQSNQHITAGWTWKYIWQSSVLKLKQMLKRFTKIQIEPLFVMVWFGKNWIHFLKICSSSKHALFSGHLKINDILNQILSFNLQHDRYIGGLKHHKYRFETFSDSLVSLKTWQ